MFSRLTQHWRLKLFLSVALNAFFWTFYSLLGRHAFFPVQTLPLTWLDRAIPFQPQPWGWIYLSQFLFTASLPWLIESKSELFRYTRGLLLMSSGSFAIFFFFPVASPRPPIAEMTEGPMAWILFYDGNFNAFPSLHAGFLVYMSLLARRLTVDGRKWMTSAISILWGGLILYATIATRQHYAVDLLAGAALGWFSDWLAWRGHSLSESEATMTARRSDVMSHRG